MIVENGCCLGCAHERVTVVRHVTLLLHPIMTKAGTSFIRFDHYIAIVQIAYISGIVGVGTARIRVAIAELRASGTYERATVVEHKM